MGFSSRLVLILKARLQQDLIIDFDFFFAGA